MFMNFSIFLLLAVYPSMAHSNKSCPLHLHYYMTQLAGKERNNFQQLYHHNPWYRGQIGTKLGTKHVIYQKLANFKRLESIIFGT